MKSQKLIDYAISNDVAEMPLPEIKYNAFLVLRRISTTTSVARVECGSKRDGTYIPSAFKVYEVKSDGEKIEVKITPYDDWPSYMLTSSATYSFELDEKPLFLLVPHTSHSLERSYLL